jgi:hypothetical protein
MSIKKIEIRDNQDNLVLPRTSTDQVIDSTGKSLETTLIELKYAAEHASGSTGYGTIADKDDNLMSAMGNNDTLKFLGDTMVSGLTSVAIQPKVEGDSKSRNTVKITSRFPSWNEIAGDPMTVFNKKEFIFENNILGVNPAAVGGGGGGGGLPFINVKSFKVWEKNPTTGVLEEVQYGAKGDNTSPDLDTKAFRRAFQIAKDEGSVNIYIPDGNYILKETVNIYRNTNVQASRNATIKKNHTGVMFANTNPNDAFIGYDGGQLLPTKNPAIKNNGNIFFDGGTWDNNGTSGSTFSFINARNFEFKNLNIKNILDSHAFDLCGIADMVIYNCNFLGFQYRRLGEIDSSGKVVSDQTTLKAYSECIQLDYSAGEAFPYQLAGHDGTACKRIRVDKCVFGKSEMFPAWNRAYGGHNTYVCTYDWLHQANGDATGNFFNFKDCKPKDIYFLNNVVEGNGTLKYDYDPNDPESFIIQQVRLQCVDNAIIMNNKFRDVKGGISVDVDQSPKTMINDPIKKNFVLAGTYKSTVMPAKVTYFDAHGDMQTIMFSTKSADQDLAKITTHVHDGITYTVVWCKNTSTIKFVDYYGWQNALIMNNELTNITCGIYSYKQATAVSSNGTALNKIVVQDIKDVLGNITIKAGSEIYYGPQPDIRAVYNPYTITSVVGVASTDMNGNPVELPPYTLTINPSLPTMAVAGTGIFLKETPSKNASTPIYVRGKTTPYSNITITTNADGSKTYKYTATGTVQDPRGEKCIIYGNIIDGLDQKTIYSQYEAVIREGRKIAKIASIVSTNVGSNTSVITVSTSDKWIKANENFYLAVDGTLPPDLTTAYQILSVTGTTTKTLTIMPALPASVTTSYYIYSRKPLLAGETGGASIINAIQGGYVRDLLIQKNVVRNVPRAIYVSGSTRVNILGNHFFKINEVEAVCLDGGDYSNIIGNTFSDLVDQAIEIRNHNYFNIATNEFLNTNKGAVYKSPYLDVNWQYDPLESPTIIIMGNGAADIADADGIYGNITGNMFVHSNAKPILTGISADANTKFIKMSNNSYPSAFTTREYNMSEVGLDVGYRGNDANTLQGKTIDDLGGLFLLKEDRGKAGGIASLGSDGKIPTSQLPSSLGGAGFKTVTAPTGSALVASSINSATSTLNIQTGGGITAETKDGNVLFLSFQPPNTDGEITVEGLASTVSYLQEDVDDLKAGINILDTNVANVQSSQATITGTTIPAMNASISGFNTSLTTANGKIAALEGDRAKTADVSRDYFNKTTTTQQTVTPDVLFNKKISINRYEEKTISITGTSVNIDVTNGNVFSHVLTGATTIASLPKNLTAGYAHTIVLYVKLGSYSLTIPSTTGVRWHNGALPTFSPNKWNEIILRSVDGGTTWFASLGGIFDVI